MSEYDELVKRLKRTVYRSDWDDTIVYANPDGVSAADAIEALVGEVGRLKRMLFPYAEDKEISGLSWNGFYLIGNRKSIDELRRIENRAAQLEVYRAEFVRRNEAAEAEVERLKGVLGEVKRRSQIDPGTLPHESQVLVKLQSCFEIARSALEAKP